MRRYCLLFTVYCLLFTGHCIAQCGSNLVPNLSFEVYSKCPDNANQVDYATGWINPTASSPDYYNACDTNKPGMSVPYCGGGGCFQYAKTGNAYVGIFALQPSFKNARDYVQTKLLSPLISGKKYCVSFYVSLTEDSRYAVSGMGAYLSNNAISLNTAFNFTYTPQVQNPAGNVLKDTLNWMLVSGCFVAQGGEQYITLGNFKTDDDCDSLQYTNLPLHPGMGANYAYYLIDDVNLTECPDTVALDIPNVFTPNDDGINDTFYLTVKNISSLQYSIYNRWGTKISDNTFNNKSSIVNNKFALWDGATTAGMQCPTGIYYYVVAAKDNEGKAIEKKGFIQLLR